MKAVGVIPGRWQSKRFPGKILTPICGRPLIHWVIENASKAQSLDEVLVATDDVRIAESVASTGVKAVMTRADHPSGTDRVAEAVEGISADIIVNIQGDEPLIEPDLIDKLVGVLAENDWEMSTAVSPIRDEEELENPGVVKVVRREDGTALYFSRSIIPHVRDHDSIPDGTLHWRHLGIYGYRRDFLKRLVQSAPCLLEEAEKLEQLRALYLGARIGIVETKDKGIGVDTPEDVAFVEQLIRAMKP
jgi:3-deoxy-manno-octulosonate cytidylyltransferase (CMP-KDO synthetase)